MYAQDTAQLEFSSITFTGLKNGDTKRIEENHLPVCGYFSKSDSLFYSCNGSNPRKIDPNQLKDGSGCCEVIKIANDPSIGQKFNLSGVLNDFDANKGIINLRSGEKSYIIELKDAQALKKGPMPGMLKTGAPINLALVNDFKVKG